MNKVALVGCGGWGRNLARNLAELDVLARIVDPSKQAQTMAEQLGAAHSIDIDDALSDPDCAAVLIATPASTHFDLAMRVVAAGKDVFIEKPIALSIEEGELLGAAADAAGRVLMVGHILQYHPAFLKLRSLVAEGRLGRLRHISSDRMSLGRLRNEENVLWSFAPHDISMICSLFDSPPKRVRAVGSTFLSSAIEDVTTAHVEFEDGVVAEIRSSWCHPRKSQSVIVVGEHAMAIFDDTLPWEEKLKLCAYAVDPSMNPPQLVRGDEVFVPLEPGEPLKLEMQHFLDCVKMRRVPRTNSDEATTVLKVLNAAQSSLKQDAEWIHV